MNMEPRFSIIIVTYNGLHHLKRFLPSVLVSMGSGDEVLIADNASTDGTADWLRRHAPTCRHLLFEVNHGYCGGNNRAAAQARGDILLFLNNDVRVEPDWLEPLRQAFRESVVDAAQPKIRSLLEPGKFEYAGASGGYLDRLAYPFCRGRILQHVETDEGQYDDPVPILWASGAAMAVRAERFGALGGFDEAFEFHMEEIDLCWRIWNRGGRIVVVPGSVVYHLGGGSLQYGDPRKTFFNYRNSLRMITRNHRRGGLFRTILLRLIVDGLSAVPHAAAGRFAHVGAIARGHFAFYRSLPSCLASRRTELANRVTAEDPPVLWRRSIVWQSVVKKRNLFSELPDIDALISRSI